MNKKFLNAMLCSLLFFGGTTGVVSCKDYDDDIAKINTTTTGLSAQISQLETALQAANAEAAAAATAAQKAIADAQNAVAQAELAKQAAAQAKAEAIAEVIAQLKPLIDANTQSAKDNATAIATLAGRIDGIEQGLSNIDLTDINKQLGDQADLIKAQGQQLQTIETQLKALEAFKKAIEDQLGGVEGIKEKIDLIDGLQTELSTLKGKVSANETAISTINGELTKLSAKISTEVSNAVNTIAGTISRRLTSVTLMPDLYVGGIPTIAFESAKYVKKELKNGQWVNSTAAKNTFIISNNTATAQYRLNPATIGQEDIVAGEMGYVSRIATARAAEVIDDIVNVASAEIGDNGVMTVKLGKSNTESLNLSNGKIYTVSLKVPIAKKHLFTENGETEASVYSEFTRLEETYFLPELAFVPGQFLGKEDHLYDSIPVYQSAAGDLIVKNLVYNKSYDLYKLVEGCKFANSKHVFVDRATLQSYGLDIEFHKANAAYAPTVDKTNQQQFVKLSGENNSILTPVSSSGQEGNQVIIGKQPIIAATLVDVVNKNVVEQKYFKVCFTAEDMEDVKIDWTDITSTGAACTGAEYNFGWKDMAERVLEILNDKKGMSKEDFTKIYGGTDPVIAPANDNNGTLVANVVAANLDASIPVMTWTLTADQLGKLSVGNNETTVTKTITFTDPTGLHPNIVINLKWVVTTNVAATSLGNTDKLKWDNNTMKVYPVPMTIPYDGKQKAAYNTNILEGRLKPYVNGLLSCATYDIDYATTGNPAYVGEALTFQSGYGHWMMTTANQGNLNEVYYTIANTAAGKNLVSNGGTIKVNWSSDINGLAKNRYVIGTVNLQIVKILSLNTTLAQGFTDNSRKQSINIGANYSLKDAYGNLVAPVATTAEPYAADYYEYYGISEVVFGNNIVVADDAAGKQNVRTLASLNMTANVDNATGVLTFQNNGAPLQGNAYLIVPVTVEHLWGTLTGTIAVPLNKSNAPLNSVRR